MRFGSRETPGYPVAYSKEQEIQFFRDQAAALKVELDEIDNRLRTLESEETASK